MRLGVRWLSKPCDADCTVLPCHGHDAHTTSHVPLSTVHCTHGIAPYVEHHIAPVAECTLGWDDEPDDYNVAYHRTAEEEVGSPHSRGRAVGRDGVQFCVTDWADSAQSPRSAPASRSFTSP